MANITADGNHTTIQELYCLPNLNKPHENMIISSFNILLSIAAFLENVLIILALRKVTSLHPPSKLLFGCLACTDLFVGLITQPLYAHGLLTPVQSKHCYISEILIKTIGVIFCGVSMLTITAISVDRLLALLLGLRYRHTVTLRRMWALVVTFWRSMTAFAILSIYSYRVATYIMFITMSLCIGTSTFCYTKIYLKLRHHQTTVQEHVHKGQPNGGRIPLNIARYRKTVSSALWVQIALLACYLPFGIVAALIAVTGERTPSLALAWDATDTFLMGNSALNPFLYCWKMKEVRQAVKDTIRQLKCFSS
ncbi:hypothetical protein ACROYT_G028703 [Oculina patagonica]